MGSAAAAPYMRSVLISDLHLGSYRCNARALSEYLATINPEVLYLVGDVIDLWSLRAGSTWPRMHAGILRQLVLLAQSGTRVVLVPGNHDATLLQFASLSIPGFTICRDALLETRNGRRYLVVHGHEQDLVFGRTNVMAKSLSGIADRIGELAQMYTTGVLRQTRRSYRGRTSKWEMSILDHGKWFDRAIVREVHRRGFDGVICGHTHHPLDCYIDGIHYLNCGDWIRACSAIVETCSGEICLIRWNEIKHQLALSHQVGAANSRLAAVGQT